MTSERNREEISVSPVATARVQRDKRTRKVKPAIKRRPTQ
jgi:hypothetical protein